MTHGSHIVGHNIQVIATGCKADAYYQEKQFDSIIFFHLYVSFN
jgi:hypothetical protein